ncbi:hypothetical protein SO694_00010360 [Aureococcus anophagefferens]|uniref:Bromo domain-containing protein n=1 Tax=Aureococcus anophagefferens TaxID=44056 RepID=A0ABR1GF20_AURAN
MKGEALHAARQVLDRLFAQDPSNLWGAPVNTALYSDYLNVVKRPMDLGTVRARVESYATMAAFAADVRLVYENSALYCKARFPDVAKGARTILRKFDKECQGPCGLPPAGRALSARGDDGAPLRDYVRRLADAKGPGQPMDLNKLEVRHRSGVYRRDVGAWVRDAWRIAANCLRLQRRRVRFPELRNAGRAWLAAVEKEVEHKLRPALRAAGATDVELDKAVPLLLPRCEKILSAAEDAVLNVYDGGVQRCYAFISPITAYYDAREQGQKRTLDDYLLGPCPSPWSVGQQAAKILDALRAVKHPDGQEAALGFLHENMLPPEQGEYATAIGGAHNARDFNRIEAKARGGGYRNLQAFGDDVAKCFANARAWKARVRKHEWVKPDGYYGKVVGWHRPAVEAFPLIRHEYLAKIARPMDLGQVHRQLNGGRYATFQAVVDDLVLVFDNAIAFNADAATGVNGPKDDLAAKMVDIASHMKHVIHHWALEFFKDEDGAAASSAATRDTAATRNGVCRDDYAVVLDAAELEREAKRKAQAEAAKALEAEARPLDKEAVDAALAGDAAAPAPAPPPEKPKGKSIEKPKLPPRAQARFDARRARDAAVWPSTLKYNPKGIGEARQVLRGVRKQHLKKHSQWFEKPCWRGVPDYSQFVSQPTCLERVDARLSLCARDRANLLDAAAAAAGIDDDKQLEPYETMGDFAAECKRIFDNALAYNERYRNDVRNAAHEVCKSADLLVPVLDEALFALALEGYERVKREEILLRWDKSTARGLNVEAAERREEHLQQRAVAKRKIEEMAARDRTSTRAKREKLLRVLGRAAVVSLDVLDAAPAAAANGDGDDEGPDRPASPEDPAAAVEAAPLVAAPGVDVSRRRDAAAKAVANAVLQALGGAASGATARPRPRPGPPAPIAAADHRRGDGAVAPFSLKKPAAKRAKRAVPDALGGGDEPARAAARSRADFGGVACAPAASGDAAFQRCAALRRDERCRRALASPEATRRGGVDGVEAAFFFAARGARLWIGGLAVAHEVLA